MYLFLFIPLVYINAIDFNCNGKFEVKVPNFEITSFFLEELYWVKLGDVLSLKCSNMDFIGFENAIFTKAANLKKLDLSENKLSKIKLPYTHLDEVILSSNNFSKFSEFTNRQNLEIKKLDISNNSLTSDSGIFNENITVLDSLDISNNLLTAIDLNKVFKKKDLKFSSVDISNNFISTLDSHIITLASSSEHIIMCPMLLNVVCREKGLAMDTEVKKLMNKAGKLDLSCLSTSLPECGDVSVFYNNQKERNSINVLFTLPDLKKVFIEKTIKIKLSSTYFNPVIVNIHKDNLIDNKFSLKVDLNNSAPINEKVTIYLHEVKSEGFDDRLSPKIAHFILKSNEDFDLYQKNYFIDNKLKQIGIIEPMNTDQSDGFVEEITHNGLSGVYYFWSIFAIVVLFILLMLYFKLVEKIAKRRNSINDFYEVSN